MEIKLFEIRDVGTTIAAMAVKLGGKEFPRERALLAHAGFGSHSLDHENYVLLGNMDDGDFRLTYDEYAQGNRTMETAHRFIKEQWDELESGALIDVQFILKETVAPKETVLYVY